MNIIGAKHFTPLVTILCFLYAVFIPVSTMMMSTIEQMDLNRIKLYPRLFAKEQNQQRNELQQNSLADFHCNSPYRSNIHFKLSPIRHQFQIEFD